MDNQPKTIITIKEMRKLLGKEYAHLSEQQVEQLIVEVELMAEITIKEAKKKLVPNSP